MAMRRLFALMVALTVATIVLLASCVNEVSYKINVEKTPIIDVEEVIVPEMSMDVEEEVVLG